MGNQLVGAAPAQIFPVEHYMSDIADLEFDVNLGSTRFLKVARARHHSGLVVVKVFTIQDAGLNLRKYLERLKEIKNVLEGCVNCLPFHQAFLTERAGFIVRQYVKDSLYDRISTRPFLTSIEKKWIAFQLLLALQQAHKHGVCHGDIKMENVMITSWNWVILSDFASFKPTFLPEDNPAEFSYFFDTSRRRTCYIAPERFKTRTITADAATNPTLSNSIIAGDPEGSSTDPEFDHCQDLLVASMDIFSAGCVLIELFTEGTPPFNFSQLLAYRAGEYSPDKVLDKIDNEAVRQMLSTMIQKDFHARLSANEHLCQQRGQVFPDYFYTFLQSYMQIFSTDPSMTSDAKVNKIYENLDAILQKLHSSEFDVQGLTLICGLITSHMRSLKFCGAKIKAAEILSRLAQHVSSDIILDRIVPFVMTLVSDRFPAVRIAAIECITSVVQAVDHVPVSDANIFADLILPDLIEQLRDRSERNDLVRAAFASKLAEIAQQSVRFLDLVMLQSASGGSAGLEQDQRPMPTYENELNVLHDLISHTVSELLTDSSNSVKQALMEHSVTKLAVFLGKQKADDIILSHMITFLNDKEDAQLRLSFYENIVGVAAFVGWQCSPILLPLLQQGLSDPEEFVIARCIDTMARLTSLQLLQKVALYELLRETAPYLLHPNLWIRQSTAGFVSATAKILDGVDVVVKLGSILQPFLRHPVIQLEHPVLILANVESAIPRQVLDDIIKTPDSQLLKEFLNLLEERQTARNMSKINHQVLYGEIPMGLKPLFRRLDSDGMTPGVEDKLLHMKKNILIISDQHRALKSSMDNDLHAAELDLAAWRIAKKSVSLDFEDKKLSYAKEVTPDDYLNSNKVASVSEEHDRLKTSPSPSALGSSPKPLSGLNVQRAVSSPSVQSPALTRKAEAEYFPEHLTFRPEINPSQSFAPCKLELEETISKKRCEFAVTTRKRRNIERTDRNYPTASWRPKGTLIAHLHEHKGGISKLVRIPDKPMFASAATDGCVRLWDCSKFEGSNRVNKHQRLFNHHNGSAINGLAVSADGQLLVSGAENGTISTYKVDGSSPKTLLSHTVDVDDEGPPVDFCFRETGSSPLIVYATAYGGIVGIDLRSKNEAFRLENDLLEGLQTSMAMSPDQCWLVNGTSSGVITCWDLRFQMPIVKCTHPAESRIRNLIIPEKSGEVLASVQGNNEVGLWNMESQFRQLVLWASTSPLLSTNQTNSHSVTAMQSIRNHNMNVLLTSGTDMRIRFWDLQNPDQSYVVAGASNEQKSPVTYKTKLVDGTEVVQEVQAKPKTSYSNPGQGPPLFGNFDEVHGNKPGLDGPTTGHVDWVSAMTLCQASRWYVVTGSRDGVIKVWK